MLSSDFRPRKSIYRFKFCLKVVKNILAIFCDLVPLCKNEIGHIFYIWYHYAKIYSVFLIKWSDMEMGIYGPLVLSVLCSRLFFAPPTNFNSCWVWTLESSKPRCNDIKNVRKRLYVMI